MDRDEKRKEAEKLYVEKCLSCATIAELLGVTEGIVYRWKAAAMVKHMSALKNLTPGGSTKEASWT
jgi:transposase